ncbi:unnamed protein product [Miscanthus lutarioriparius]|uniref:V-type proton ATPase proteolipid subunit n=2 Tax=Miscanthus lutarioriparius TaxID=422564 RepID=A0A811Q6L1_9POAL|nr:unnamed protein product [Miscanthus lutarioriparius]
MSSVFSGDETAPFFGFLGAAAALIFSCSFPLPPSSSSTRALNRFRTQSSSFSPRKFEFFSVHSPICRRSSVVRLDLTEPQLPVSAIPGAPVLDLPDSVPVGCGIPEIDGLFRSGSGAGMGAAYGTAKSGVGVASMGVMRPELVMKSIVPVVMAGVLGIYGLIIAVIISTGINPKAKPYYLFDGYAHLSSGLACGLAGLAAGMAIGIVGDAGVRANAQQPKLFVGMILILIFAEALALYGLIVGIILSSRAGQSRAE